MNSFENEKINCEIITILYVFPLKVPGCTAHKKKKKRKTKHTVAYNVTSVV